MFTASRDHATDFPPAAIFKPTKSTTGPVGPCSPGIHSGYSSVIGPGLAGMVMDACKMWRGASVISTRSFICALSNGDKNARIVRILFGMFTVVEDQIGGRRSNSQLAQKRHRLAAVQRRM